MMRDNRSLTKRKRSAFASSRVSLSSVDSFTFRNFRALPPNSSLSPLDGDFTALSPAKSAVSRPNSPSLSPYSVSSSRTLYRASQRQQWCSRQCAASWPARSLSHAQR